MRHWVIASRESKRHDKTRVKWADVVIRIHFSSPEQIPLSSQAASRMPASAVIYKFFLVDSNTVGQQEEKESVLVVTYYHDGDKDRDNIQARECDER